MGTKLDAIIADVNKKAKEEIMTTGMNEYNYERIPFTSPRMNYITYGGIPSGRLIEFFGEEGGGKTTTALDIVANFQNMFPDREVLYVDAENTLDTDWARKIGVDVDRLILLQPKTQPAEEIFQILLDATETGEVGLWILDSVPCLVSINDLEKKLTDAQRVAGISGILTAFLRRIVGPCVKNECTGIFINQIRDKINSQVPMTTTPGGRALRHYCTIRMEFRKGAYIDENGKNLSRSSGTPESQQIMVNMVKTKSCRPTRHVGYYTINYDNGIDYLADLIEIAIMYDIVDQKGAWYTIIDTETGEVLKDKIQGQSNLSKFLDENPEITERVEQLVEQAME